MSAGGSSVDGYGIPIDGLDYVVMDVETTGLFPHRADRITELALVRMSSDGRMLDEWATLINPGRDLGPTSIHGLTASDVLDAPLFHELLGDVSERLAGAVLVAHNTPFDLRFLSAEFARCGHSWPRVAALCTMTLPARLGLRVPARSLAGMCSHLEIPWDDDQAHTALADARSTGQVLAYLLGEAARLGYRTLGDLGCLAAPADVSVWPVQLPCGRIHTRDHAATVARKRFGFLNVIARRAADRSEASADADTVAPYLDLLDRVLEDHLLTDVEAETLTATAADWGLSSGQIERAHHAYLGSLVDQAWADGLVSTGERRELVAVGYWLGVDKAAITRLVDTQETHVKGSASLGRSSLSGLSVCFTGQLCCAIGGQPITRDNAARLAREAGLSVAERVTKMLDLLVVADPSTQSGKARKARDYGTRIVAEHAFWRLLGVTVD